MGNERTLLDDLRDYRAGKIKDKYYNGGTRQEFSKSTRSLSQLQPSIIDTAQGVYERDSKPSAQNNIRNNEHGNANITGIPEYVMDRVYSGYSYSQLKAEAQKPEYKNNQPKINYLNSKAEEVATSKDLQAEYDNLQNEYNSLYDRRNETDVYNRLREIEDNLPKLKDQITQKQRTERLALNQKVKDKKIKDFELTRAPRDYADYLYQYENAEDEDIKEWTKQKTYELATSEQLQAEYDRLMGGVGTRPDGTLDRNAKKKIDDLGFLELIDKKKQEENEQKYYYDIVQNDPKAATILQKYYEYKNDMSQPMGDLKVNHGSFYFENPQSNFSKYTPDEIKSLKEQFNALSEKYDTDKLLKYYGRIKEREENQQKLEDTAKWSKEHPWLASGSSVIENTVGSIPDAIKYFGAYLEKHLAGGDGYIDPNGTNVANAQAKREAVAEDWGALGQFIYSTGMSVADFVSLLPLNFIPGGQSASLAVLGTSAGVSTANEVIKNGGGVDKAVTSGVMSGIFESLFEKVSLEQLKVFKQSNKTDLKSVIKNIFKGAVTEGSEELFTDVANFVSDGIINADLSSVSLQYKSLLEQGYSEDEAWKTCAVDFAKQLGLSFAGGALSGAAMNAGVAGINIAGANIEKAKFEKMSTLALGQTLVNNENFDLQVLISQGLKANEKSNAHKLAARLEKISKKKSPDIVDIANLAKLVQNEIKTDKKYKQTLLDMYNSGEAKYITSKSFEEQIDDVIEGKHNSRYDLFVSYTPDIYTELNFPKSPLLMRNGKISDILEKHPEMSSDILKQIPSAIKNPILILKSKTHSDESVVAITSIDTKKGEVIVPIWINQQGNFTDVELGDVNINANFVASAYGRNTKHLIEYALDNNEVIYKSEDKERVSNLFARYGLQLPKPLKVANSTVRVSQNNQTVNSNSQKSGWRGSAPSSPAVMDEVKAGTYTGDENEDFNFGEKHPNGAAAKTEDGATILIKGIETSSRAYGEADNTIMLKTKDGKLVNSDDVKFYDENIQELMSFAKQFDTIGARTYVSAYEQAVQDLGEDFNMGNFSKGFYLFYNVGRTGVKFETLSSSGKYNAAIETVSPIATYRAVLSGNMDSNFKFKNEANAVQRVKSEQTPEGRLYVEDGTKYDLEANADISEALQGLSSKIGVDIVISDNLSRGEAVGEFRRSEGKIYINSKVDTSYMLSIALHEAGHWLRTTSPEDFKLISDFVVNYLESKGYNVLDELDEIKQKYRRTYSDDELDTHALEELVCNSLMSIASDEKAANLTISNGKKLANALKRLVSKMREYLLNKTAPYTRVYKAFVNDTEALLKLADMVGKGFENGRGVEVVSEEQGNSNYLIVPIDNKKSYVKASRQVIFGNDISKWGNQVTNYINKTIRQKNNVIVYAKDGTALTITKNTAGKAQFRNFIKLNDGSRRLMTDEEYAVKLRAETHIDELSEVSIGNKKTVKDYKNHTFAKDGFEYRTAYFMDFDGKYYKLTISVGKNGLINSVYNVGKIKETEHPLVTQRSNRIISAEDEFISISTKTVSQNQNNVKQNSKNNDYLINDELHNDSSSDEDYSNTSFLLDDENNTFKDYLKGEYETDTSSTNFLKLIEKNPSAAAMIVYKKALEISKIGMYDSGDIKLNKSQYTQIARKVLSNFDIAPKYSKKAVFDFSDKLSNFTNRIEETSKYTIDYDLNYFNALFNDLTKLCTQYAGYSNRLDQKRMENIKRDVLGFITDNVLIVSDEDINLIKMNYGDVREYRARLVGKTRVGMARNGVHGYRIADVIDYVRSKYPKLASENNIGNDGGYKWFELLINDYLEPKINRTITTKNSGSISYFQDKETAGFEMALQAVNEIMKAKRRAGVNDKTKLKAVSKLNKSTKANEELFLILSKAERRIAVLESRLDRKERVIARGMRAVRNEYFEARMRNVERGRLLSRLNKFSKMFTDKKQSRNYIPIEMREPIIKVLKMVDGSRGTYRSGINKGKLKDSGKAFNEFTKNVEDISSALKELNECYEKLKNEQPEGLREDLLGLAEGVTGFDEETSELLKQLEDKFKGRSIYDMTGEDLRQLREAIDELDKSLKRPSEVIIGGKRMLTNAVAEITAAELLSVGEKKGGVNSIAGLVKMALNELTTSSLDSVRLARRICGYHEDYVFYRLISDIHSGERKAQAIEKKGTTPIEEALAVFKNKEIKSMLNDDVSDFDFKDIDSGKRVQISQSMLISIYLTAKQDAGKAHLFNDNHSYNIRLDDLKLTTANGIKSDITKAHEKGRNENSHRIKITEADLERINKYVEGHEITKAAAQALSYGYNEIVANELNVVSMQREGRKLAVVKDYCPIIVDKSAKEYKGEYEFKSVYSDLRMKNRSFTKERTKSTLPIKIGDPFTQYFSHLKQTSEYCGMLIPIESFMKIYNNGNDFSTVKGIVEKSFGTPVTKYIEKFISDLQKKNVEDNSLLMRIQSRRMGAVLYGNIGTALSQLGAYPTAYKYFGAKNVAKAATVGYGKVDVDLYSKYTPYLWYRERGNGTIMGEIGREKGLYQKAADKIDVVGKLDRVVVSNLLYAAELHVAQTTDLKKGTEAFYREVVRQFEKCIDETQPNNMITSKPQFIRNRTMRILGLSAFKSQILAIGNTIIDDLGEYNARMQEYNSNKSETNKKAAQKAGKKLLKTIIGAVTACALSGLLRWIRDLLFHKTDKYRDENGKFTAGKFIGNYIDSVLGECASIFLWGDQCYEVISSLITKDKFYGFEAMSLSSINEFIDNLKRGDYLNGIAGLLDCLGKPGTNGLKTIRSVSAYAYDLANGVGIISKDNTFGFFDGANTEYFADYIIDSKKSGNGKKADKLVSVWTKQLRSDGKSSEQIRDSIKSKLVSAMCEDEEIQAAAVAFANGDFAAYESAVDKVAGYGFDKQDVVKAVKKVNSTLVSEFKEKKTSVEDASDELIEKGYSESGAKAVLKNYSPSESAAEDDEIDVFSNSGNAQTYSYNDLFEAKLSGNDDCYGRVYEYFKSMGKDDKQINSILRSASRTDPIFEKYLKAVKESNRQELEKYKAQLMSIYGSWSEVQKALKRYRERKNK